MGYMNLLFSQGVDRYGAGGRTRPQYLDGGTLSQVSPHYMRSRVKSSCLYSTRRTVDFMQCIVLCRPMVPFNHKAVMVKIRYIFQLILAVDFMAFISPKRIFYFDVDKASASVIPYQGSVSGPCWGSCVPQAPWDVRPSHADRSMPMSLPNILMARVEQPFWCVRLSLCVRTITFEGSDFDPDILHAGSSWPHLHVGQLRSSKS